MHCTRSLRARLGPQSPLCKTFNMELGTYELEISKNPQLLERSGKDTTGYNLVISLTHCILAADVDNPANVHKAKLVRILLYITKEVILKTLDFQGHSHSGGLEWRKMQKTAYGKTKILYLLYLHLLILGNQ